MSIEFIAELLHRPLKTAGVAIVLVVSIGVSVPACAVSVPWRDATFSYTANDTPLSRILEDLLATQFLAIDISEAVRRMPAVSGEFSQSPRQVFEQLSHAYGLVAYYDGTTIYVSSLAENKTELHALSSVSAGDVERVANEFGYLDKRFVFRRSGPSSALQISGPPAYLQRIADVVAMLQSGANGQQRDTRVVLRVIPLAHAWPEDATYNVAGRDIQVRGVASTLRQLVGLTPLDAAEYVSDEPYERNYAKAMSPESLPVARLPLLGGLLSGREQGPESTSDNRDIPPSFNAKASISPSRSRGPAISIVGDSRMNAVVVMAPVGMMDMIEGVIKELDVEQELIQIEATVMEIQDGAMQEIGFDWGVQGRHFEVGFSNSKTSSSPVWGAESALPHNIAVVAGSQATRFLSRIQALQSSGRANILSRPRLATLNSTEAMLSTSRVFYPRVQGERVAQLYRVEAGLSIRVVPVLVKRAEGKPDIRLRVVIEDGGIEKDFVIDGLPVTSNSSITTQAIVGDGESLLIGGYVRDEDGNSTSKVPVLGDLPVLGHVFRYERKERERRERLFLITPTVLKSGPASRPSKDGSGRPLKAQEVPASNRPENPIGSDRISPSTPN